MRRFTSNTEPWGEFVDIKTNAVELMKKIEVITKSTFYTKANRASF